MEIKGVMIMIKNINLFNINKKITKTFICSGCNKIKKLSQLSNETNWLSGKPLCKKCAK